MSLESDLMQPERQGEDPPPPPKEETPPPPIAAAPPLDDDAALDKLIEEQSIALPDGEEKLVPLSAVTTLRGKLAETKKELGAAKEGSTKAQQLEETVAQLQQTINQWQPYVQAYNAALQQAQQQPHAAVKEDTTELEEIARDLDLYNKDGSMDLDRARRIQARETKRAERIADARVAPIINQSTSQAARTNRERAKNTVFPSGEKADPEMVDLVFNQLDESVTATEAGAKFAALQALGMSRGLKAGAPGGPQRGPDGKFVPQQAAPQLPPPIIVERAGGKDTPSELTLTDVDRRAIKAMGISEKEYLESAASMPRGAR